VPFIIHQTAPDDRRRWDPRWKRCHETWQAVCPSPKHRHRFWDDAGLRALVAEAFPEHLGVYDGYGEHIQRVDFARAAMLFLQGGLYVDMDVEVMRSPFPHFPPGVVSIVESPYRRNEKHQNSMMASPPRHPFWCALVDEAARRREMFSQYTTTWQLTGPQLLDAVAEARIHDVFVLPAREFNPAASSPDFAAPGVFTRHLCTSVWTHSMDTSGMRLYQAARAGDKVTARQSVEEEGADLQCRDYAGLTPLHHAALKGDADMIGLLISLRADVNAQDKNDTTALHFTVQAQNAVAVRTLLAARANVGARLREGSFAGATPADLARVCLEQSLQSSPSARAVLALFDTSIAATPSRQKVQAEKPWWAAAAAVTAPGDSRSKSEALGAPAPAAAAPQEEPATTASASLALGTSSAWHGGCMQSIPGRAMGAGTAERRCAGHGLVELRFCAVRCTRQTRRPVPSSGRRLRRQVCG